MNGARPDPPPTAEEIFALGKQAGYPGGTAVWTEIMRRAPRVPREELRRLHAVLMRHLHPPLEDRVLAEPAAPTEAELLELVESAEDEMGKLSLRWPS